ncbi:hypothetical protein [Kordia sp.]|uniref:hypothetical protein n=1 Tax=Kordia sp. TaxID=1965332 RepID=UPI003D274326
MRFFYFLIFLFNANLLISQVSENKTHLVLDVVGKVELLSKKDSMYLKQGDKIFLDESYKIIVHDKVGYVRLWNFSKKEYDSSIDGLSNLKIYKRDKTLKGEDLISRGFSNSNILFVNQKKVLNPKLIKPRLRDANHFITFFQKEELIGENELKINDDGYLVIDEKSIGNSNNLNDNTLLRIGYYTKQKSRKYYNIYYLCKDFKRILHEIDLLRNTISNIKSYEDIIRVYIETFYCPYSDFQIVVNNFNNE